MMMFLHYKVYGPELPADNETTKQTAARHALIVAARGAWTSHNLRTHILEARAREGDSPRDKPQRAEVSDPSDEATDMVAAPAAPVTPLQSQKRKNTAVVKSSKKQKEVSNSAAEEDSNELLVLPQGTSIGNSNQLTASDPDPSITTTGNIFWSQFIITEVSD